MKKDLLKKDLKGTWEVISFLIIWILGVAALLTVIAWVVSGFGIILAIWCFQQGYGAWGAGIITLDILLFARWFTLRYM